MTRALLATIAILILSGCERLTPTIIDSPYPEEEVITAIDNFTHKWEVVFEQDIREYTDRMTVTFYEKEDWFKDGCVRGELPSYREIRVGYPVNDYPIEDTALWHEMTHLAFASTTDPMDADADHAEGDGPWTDLNDQIINALRQEWRDHGPDL